MLSVNTHEDDIWCIDPRGHLTLSVSKDTYERLGIVGKKLPFKIHNDRHGALLCLSSERVRQNKIKSLVIDMVLCNTSESTTVQAKIKMSLEDWDKRRAVELGDEAGAWEVLYCSTGEVYKKPVLFLFPLGPLIHLFFFSFSESTLNFITF